jgi:alcohol dehydrogenase class IV
VVNTNPCPATPRLPASGPLPGERAGADTVIGCPRCGAIVLPHALRFNQDAAADQLAEAAIVLDLAARQDGPGYAASRVVEEIDRLARDLELPRNLGDYGVRDEDVPGLARTSFDGGPVKNNPMPIDDPGQIEDFLRAML